MTTNRWALGLVVLVGAALCVVALRWPEPDPTHRDDVSRRANSGEESPRLVGRPHASSSLPEDRAETAQPARPERSIRVVVLESETMRPLSGAVVGLVSVGETAWTESGDRTAPFTGIQAYWETDEGETKWVTAFGRDGSVDEALPASAVQRGRTGADGKVELRVPVDRVLLVVRREGYANRVIDIVPFVLSIECTMQPAREVVGRVVLQDGRPVPDLAIAMVGTNGEGYWTERTDAEGWLRMEIGARAVVPVSRRGTHVVSWPIRAIRAGEETEIRVERVPQIAVTDASDGGVISSYTLSVRGTRMDGIWHSREVREPRGRAPLVETAAQWRSLLSLGLVEVIVVSGEHGVGHRELDLSTPSGQPEWVVPVEVGAPSAGHTVRLGVAGSDGSHALQISAWRRRAWTPGELPRIAVAEPAPQGAYTVDLPSGRYVATTHSGFWHVFESPAPEVVEMDPGDASRLVVEVTDEGRPIAGGIVVIQHERDRALLHRPLDGRGTCRLEGLPSGAWVVHARRGPPAASPALLRGERLARILLRPAAEERVRVDLSQAERTFRRVRLQGPGGADTTGWKVKPMIGHDSEWIPVQGGGDFVGNFGSGRRFYVASGEQWRWMFRLPEFSGSGGAVDVEIGSRAYAGVLLDGATGAPLSGWRVLASCDPAPDAGLQMVRAWTDASGAFQLEGLVAGPWQLTFKGPSMGNPLAFVPQTPPGLPATDLRIDLPILRDDASPPGVTAEDLTCVLDIRSEPLGKEYAVEVWSTFPGTGGTWLLLNLQGTAVVANGGSCQVRVHATGDYLVKVFDRASEPGERRDYRARTTAQDGRVHLLFTD